MVEERSLSDEVRAKALVDRSEETLPAQVARRKVRILSAENLRFPEEGSSAQGQSGANARPKGVADAHPVNNPELPIPRYYEGGTQEANQAHDWTCGLRLVGRSAR